MNKKLVRDLMVSLNDYATVSGDASFVEVLETLKKAAEQWPAHLHPPRAVIVLGDRRKVVGQLGHLELLKALEPRYNLLGNLDILSRAGVSGDLLDAVVDGFWRGELSDVCRRAATVKVSDLMRPITESVDAQAPLSEAIHKIVMWQTIRVLVTSKGEVVGVLRLADIIDEVTDCLVSRGEGNR